MRFIKIQGQFYTILGLYHGSGHFGSPLDVNNETILSHVIWEKQPFLYENEMSWIDKIKVAYFRSVRFFKKDVFGRSQFKALLHGTNS